jgi:hypothetical protein
MKTTLRTKKLPRGFGSIQKRRRTYWMIFTNAAGKKVQENSGSDRPEIAYYMLARHAQERVAAMKVNVDEAAKAAWEALNAYAIEASNEAGTARRPRAIGRFVRNASEVMRTGTKGQGGTR